MGLSSYMPRMPRGVFFDFDTPLGRGLIVGGLAITAFVAATASRGELTDPRFPLAASLSEQQSACADETRSAEDHLSACTHVFLRYMRGFPLMNATYKAELQSMQDSLSKYERHDISYQDFLSGLHRNARTIMSGTQAMERNINDIMIEFTYLVDRRMQGRHSARWEPIAFYTP